jgi:hypothetical protein
MPQRNEVASKLAIISPLFHSALSALSRLGLFLADDFKCKTLAAWSKFILVRAKCKHIPDVLWRWQAKIVTTTSVDARQT